jgi:hypothetical protein
VRARSNWSSSPGRCEVTVRVPPSGPSKLKLSDNSTARAPGQCPRIPCRRSRSPAGRGPLRRTAPGAVRLTCSSSSRVGPVPRRAPARQRHVPHQHILPVCARPGQLRARGSRPPRATDNGWRRSVRHAVRTLQHGPAVSCSGPQGSGRQPTQDRNRGQSEWFHDC